MVLSSQDLWALNNDYNPPELIQALLKKYEGDPVAIYQIKVTVVDSEEFNHGLAYRDALFGHDSEKLEQEKEWLRKNHPQVVELFGD